MQTISHQRAAAIIRRDRPGRTYSDVKLAGGCSLPDGSWLMLSADGREWQLLPPVSGGSPDEQGRDPFRDSFMQPFTYNGPYWRVETSRGDYIVPAEDVGTDADRDTLAAYAPEGVGPIDADDIDDTTLVCDGWYGRMSAPGYLDCTDWESADSEEALMASFVENYGSDDGDSDPADDGDIERRESVIRERFGLTAYDDDSDPDGLDEFLDSYVETALWSSDTHDEEGNSLGTLEYHNYSADDIAPDSLASMREDCRAFLRDNARLIGNRTGRAGHDFWLTRNRHGAGFWDGDWDDNAGRILTEAAHAYGSSDLYVGDDGKIHCS